MSCIGGARQEQQPTGCTVSEETAMGSDEENIIRYMAGYIPFKLMKVYEKRDTQEDANVLDCLSDMAIADQWMTFMPTRKNGSNLSTEEACLRSKMLSSLFSESWRFLQGACCHNTCWQEL